jgi:aryl-alcohol dehydrogenase-like predicted oxidoreductase
MLQTERLDLFLSHTADSEFLASRQIYDTFAEIKNRGFAKSIGVSTYGVVDTATAIHSGKWDVVQLSMNLMDQSCRPLLKKAKQTGVGVMVRSALMRGILSNSNFIYHDAIQNVKKHRLKFVSMLESGEKLSDMAVRFLLAFDEISTVLVGNDKKEFLDDAVSVSAKGGVDARHRTILEELAYPDPGFLNFAVWDRNGWLEQT